MYLVETAKGVKVPMQVDERNSLAFARVRVTGNPEITTRDLFRAALAVETQCRVSSRTTGRTRSA